MSDEAGVARCGRLPDTGLDRAVFVWLTYNGAAPEGTVPLDGGFGFVLDNLAGGRNATASLLQAVVQALQNSLGTFFSLFVFKVLLRRTWSAVAAATTTTFLGPALLPVVLTNGTLTAANLILVAVCVLPFSFAVRFGFFAPHSAL